MLLEPLKEKMVCLKVAKLDNIVARLLLHFVDDAAAAHKSNLNLWLNSSGLLMK